MTYQDSIKVCFRKYADFSGRASLSEFWWFLLFLGLASAAAAIFGYALQAIFHIATLLPLAAAAARRLHDTGRSAWWLLFAFVPLVGLIVLAIFLAERGKSGD
jgi:uncharacterized membrane protein YhaH (DUF805 family)